MFICGFAFMFFAPQSPVLAQEDDIGIIEGRLANVTEPIKDNDVATKKYIDDAIDSLPEIPAVLQTLGQSEIATVSQKALTEAIEESKNASMLELNKNKIPIITTTGSNTELIATVPDWEVAIGKMLVIIPHVTGASNAVTLNVNDDGAKLFSCVDSSGATGGFAFSDPVVTAGNPTLVARGESHWHILNISKPNVSSVNGVLPVENGGTGSTTVSAAKTTLGIPSLPVSIANGGTGATTAANALTNLGIPITSGTWTPSIRSRNGTNPTYTVLYRYARWVRINNLCYVSFHGKWNITNGGTDYARITGLPFAAASNMNGQSLALHEMFGGINRDATRVGVIPDNSTQINLQGVHGSYAAQWQTGDTWIGFSGVYLCV